MKSRGGRKSVPLHLDARPVDAENLQRQWSPGAQALIIALCEDCYRVSKTEERRAVSFKYPGTEFGVYLEVAQHLHLRSQHGEPPSKEHLLSRHCEGTHVF